MKFYKLRAAAMPEESDKTKERAASSEVDALIAHYLKQEHGLRNLGLCSDVIRVTSPDSERPNGSCKLLR